MVVVFSMDNSPFRSQICGLSGQEHCKLLRLLFEQGAIAAVEFLCCSAGNSAINM